MRVTVEYFGPARDAAGTASEEVDCDPQCSARELVMRIARARGGRLASLLLRDGQLSPAVLLVINDQQIDNKSAAVRDGDTVLIIPPVSGGAR